MRHIFKLLTVCATFLAAASAVAQPPEIPKALRDLLPEGAVLGEVFQCPDAAEPLTKPECCRITVDIDATGKATNAAVTCTFTPLEASQKACQLGRKYEPRITNDGPVSYSRTSYQEHYPAFRNAADFKAMGPAAELACDTLRAKDAPR